MSGRLVIGNPKAYWIKCNLDGRGEKWRLAVEVLSDDEDMDESDIMYLFPWDDMFEDYIDNYEDNEKIEVITPEQLEMLRDTIRKLRSEVKDYEEFHGITE